MERPKLGIVVDASCIGNPGPAEYRAIDLSNGAVLFHCKIGKCTNNVAEYLALAHAIKHCEDKKIKTTIFSDSYTAISWVSKRSVNSTFTLTDETVVAYNQFSQARGYLAEKKHLDCVIEKWETNAWGENPADFGEKQTIKKKDLQWYINGMIKNMKIEAKQEIEDGEKVMLWGKIKMLEKLKLKFNID